MAFQFLQTQRGKAVDFGAEIGQVTSFNQQFAQQKISTLMAGEERASQTAQGVANLSEQAQGLFQEKIGQFKEQAQSKAEQLPLDAELAVAGLPAVSDVLSKVANIPGRISQAYNTLSEGFNTLKTGVQGARTAATSLMENPGQILGAVKNSIQQRISSVDFTPIESQVYSQFEVPESMAGMSEAAEPLLTLAKQVAAPVAEESSALPGTGTSIEMTTFGAAKPATVVSTSAEDAATEIGAGVGEVAAEGGLEATALAVPGVGEAVAAGLAVYGLYEGIKDLFSGAESPPSAPAEQEAPQQEMPSFTSQASGQSTISPSFQSGI